MVTLCLFCPNHTNRFHNHVRNVRGFLLSQRLRIALIAELDYGSAKSCNHPCWLPCWARNLPWHCPKNRNDSKCFLGLIILNEPVGWAAFALILIGVLGVIALSDSAAQSGAFTDRIFNRARGKYYSGSASCVIRYRPMRNVTGAAR